MYSIVWKYQVQQENRAAFELEYGKRGAWARLFGQSFQYGGSFLHKERGLTTCYLLIDTWDDEPSYRQFIADHRKLYDELSQQFEGLYETEEHVGSFEAVP